MREPDFYRERARVADQIAKHLRDGIAKQMMRKAAVRWRELAKLSGETRATAPGKTKKQSLPGKLARPRKARQRSGRLHKNDQSIGPRAGGKRIPRA
jgi:hypothetical protein